MYTFLGARCRVLGVASLMVVAMTAAACSESSSSGTAGGRAMPPQPDAKTVAAKVNLDEIFPPGEGRDLVLVESLSPQSYEKEHLPGAINIPKERVRELAPRLLPDKGAEIVVYCANLQCPSSTQTAQALQGLGYTNVADYEAGKADWIEAGLPVESGAPAEIA